MTGERAPKVPPYGERHLWNGPTMPRAGRTLPPRPRSRRPSVAARVLAALHLPHRHAWRVTYTDDDECALPGCTKVRLWPVGGVVSRHEAARRERRAQ